MKKLYLLAFLFFAIAAQAFQPLKVDLNQSGRSETETNEPGYIPWIFKTGVRDSVLFTNGVTVVFSTLDNSYLKTNWYKAGISGAKLVSDGLFLQDTIGDPTNNVIKMRIKGLETGSHSVLTFHNHVDNPVTNTFAPMDVFLNTKQVAQGLVPTVRIANNEDATKFYTTFQAKEGEDVVLEFKRTAEATANNKTIVINAFEIDTRNADSQAKIPFPIDGDEHVDGDTKGFLLGWTGAEGAVSHHVYVGTNSEKVFNALTNSPEFKGNQTTNRFQVNDLYSMLTYYWRIDEVNATGEVTKGVVWSFRIRQLAFQGAEGYGRFARGGRGGIVVKVTNLNDDGLGSLRDAIQNPTYEGIPRTIIFDVSGRIKLESRLSINKPYITLAGQTAPGKGICVSGNAFGIGGVNDVIIRHLRLRVGTEETTDGMGQSGSNHCIIDHSSISWSKDEATSSRDAFNITFQRTLISEPLNRAGHKNYPAGTAHGYAGSIGGDVGSYHHNLLVHCYGRNWSLAGGLDGNGVYKGKMDIFNNVIYNWGSRTTDGGAHEVNFVSNYYKPGVETTQFRALNAQWDGFPGSQKYYCMGNMVEGRYENLADPRNGCTSAVSNPDPWSDVPFFESYATIHSAKDAYKHVISDVGANQPIFDDHDARIVEETLLGSWTFRGSYNSPNGTRGIIDNPTDVGGWEEYGTEARTTDYDSDNDGLPDWWERIIGTNPNSAAGDFSDANTDDNKDGFTNLDTYLAWLSNPHYVISKGDVQQIDLLKLAKGFTLNPVYSVSEIKNCSVTIDKQVANVTHNSETESLGSFVFTVTDSEGSSMSRKIEVHLTGSQTGIIEHQVGKFSVSYLNPVTDLLALTLSTSVAGVANISVLDLAGRSLLSQNKFLSSGTELCPIDVSSLSSGVLFLKVHFEGDQKTVKFIKR